ncbi:50S ribosomal protein L18 [Candidatus Gottesmanbacteria bacterium]|nr:50S ribosomal protein L18 [Candidatus Gottesmanbacteria bacterium]
MNKKLISKLRRAKRTRGRFALGSKPRLSVHRSNKYLYAQIIDDNKGITLFALKTQKASSGQTPMDQIKKLGTQLAQKAAKKGLKEVIFDRGSYKYHGRVKALAEGAREGGLIF